MAGTRRSGRRSAASLRPAGDTVKPLTPYELRDTFAKLNENAERLPRELYLKLWRLLEWHLNQQPWTMERIICVAGIFVRYAMREAGRREIVDDSAFEYAAKAVADTPAQGGPAAMKRSYAWDAKAPRPYRPWRLGLFRASLRLGYFRRCQNNFWRGLACSKSHGVLFKEHRVQ